MIRISRKLRPHRTCLHPCMLWYKTIAVIIRRWGTAKIHVLWSLSDRLVTGRSRVGWRWFVRYTISIYLDP
jgi:hypothetical protein